MKVLIGAPLLAALLLGAGCQRDADAGLAPRAASVSAGEGAVLAPPPMRLGPVWLVGASPARVHADLLAVGAEHVRSRTQGNTTVAAYRGGAQLAEGSTAYFVFQPLFRNAAIRYASDGDVEQFARVTRAIAAVYGRPSLTQGGTPARGGDVAAQWRTAEGGTVTVSRTGRPPDTSVLVTYLAPGVGG